MSLPASMLRALKSYRDETKTLANKAATARADINLASLFRQLPENLEEDYAHVKRTKTLCELILLSCAVCGIEFCYAAETAFVSPTLLKIGIPIAYMTFVWGVSPAVGFILVPILGSLSDRCPLKLGRRRPFILAMSIGIILGLLLVPNGKKIGILIGDIYVTNPSYEKVSQIGNNSILNFNRTLDELHHSPLNYSPLELTSREYEHANDESEYNHNPWGIFFTILGVVLLDLNCDACQSPCRTYLLDVSIPEDHTRGLSTFTVMAGLGGSMGYLLGAINWEKTNFGESLGGHVRVVFTIVLLIYSVCLLLTVTSVKEVPLEKLGITNEDLQKSSRKVTITSSKKYRKFVNEEDSTTDEECKNVQGDFNSKDKYGATDTNYVIPSSPINSVEVTVGNNDTVSANQLNEDTPAEHHNTKSVECYEMRRQDSQILPSQVSLKTYLLSIVRMPKSLIILCVTNLFSWMSLVCYSLYFTDFVGQAVFSGEPSAQVGSEAHVLYEHGVRWGSMGMALYSASCSAYSMCIGKLVRRLGARPVYIVSQLVYTVGALSMAYSKNRVAVIVLSPTAGIMYATLFTMPYFLVAHYHSTGTFEEGGDGESQIRGLGTDVAAVSSMVFIAQFLLSLVIGGLIHSIGSTSVVMYTAAILSLCGAVSATQVMYMGM